MTEDFRNVKITKALADVIGESSPGPRFYRAEGDRDAYVRWWDVLSKHFPRGLVSPGGACPYSGVSRAAVHKAMQEGRLTVFAFHTMKEQRGIFGSKQVRSSPYLYLPVVELKAWRVELEERIGKLQATGVDLERIFKELKRELEGGQPDWAAHFVDDHPSRPVVRKRKR